jgi:glycosyltransferase involved in cell wall biosynthesis
MMSIAVVEAIAIPLPMVIVTSCVQIAPEITEAKAGVVVKRKEDAIAQLLSYPQLQQQLSENGQSLVNSQYSWSAIAQNLSTAYQAILT